ALRMTKGYLYYNFENKEEILFFCHDYSLDVLLDVLDRLEGSGGSPAAHLRSLIESSVHHILDDLRTTALTLDFQQLSPPRLRHLDAEGIERAVLVNYPSPDLMGFTTRVNEYVAEYCAAAPDRLLAMGGVHPRFTEDAAAEVRRAADMGVRALKLHPPHMAVEPNAYLSG